MSITQDPLTNEDVDQFRLGDIEAATYAECRKLAAFLIQEWGADGPENLSGMHVGVIPRYISDGPGFAGKVYVVVWSGSPGFITTVAEAADGTMQVAANQGA